MPGVESAQVSLNEGRVVIRLEPGNIVSLAQIRRGLERNGFTPREATMSGQADLVVQGARLQLEISGTNDTYDMAATTRVEVMEQLRKHAGQAVAIEGTIPAPKDPGSVPVIQVTSAKPVTRE